MTDRISLCLRCATYTPKYRLFARREAPVAKEPDVGIQEATHLMYRSQAILYRISLVMFCRTECELLLDRETVSAVCCRKQCSLP